MYDVIGLAHPQDGPDVNNPINLHCYLTPLYDAERYKG